MPEELMSRLAAHGWVYLSSRKSTHGLTLHKLGRNPETGLGGTLRRYAETEERSEGGWQYWLVENAA